MLPIALAMVGRPWFMQSRTAAEVSPRSAERSCTPRSAAASQCPKVAAKSGLMVGLGESRIEIQQVMDDLRVADVDFLTIGQYLQPTVKHAAIESFITPEEFAEYAALARAKGFRL